MKPAPVENRHRAGRSAIGLASWTARLSAGSGLFAPTPFTEDDEELALARIPRPEHLVAERARSVSADVGGLIGEVALNGFVYASDIRHTAALRRVGSPSGDDGVLVNAMSPTQMGGAGKLLR